MTTSARPTAEANGAATERSVEVAAGGLVPDGPAALAHDFLLAGRLGDVARSDSVTAELAASSERELELGLPDDRSRMAFWIDVYNGAAMRATDLDFESWRGRIRFMRSDIVTIAGHRLSLGFIEHGILRRSRWRFGLGYVRSRRVAPFEERHRVERPDPRIHFALNCAAASCPPIAAYSADRIDAQLDVSTRSYLASSVEIDEDVARIPQIFLWFRGDFRAAGGVRAFITDHGVDVGDRKLRYAAYDWTPAPGVWTSDGETDEA